jgi:hypothetical protein
MKRLNYITIYLLLSFLLIISCSTPKVAFDYDKAVTFSAYKTYNFYPDLQLNMNQLDSSRVIDQVEKIMTLKGFKKSILPDVYVNIVSNLFEDNSNSSIGLGIGGGGRNVGIGIGGGIPLRSNKFIQQFKFDLIDVSKDILIWQGTYEGKVRKGLSPKDKVDYFSETFEKILGQYPPK